MAQTNGGPAFPSGQKWTTTDYSGNREECGKSPQYKGMSYRAWVAGQVMASRMAVHTDLFEMEYYAKQAVDAADALIAELAKEKS